MEKKLDGNYTRMLQAILNKTWWQHPTKQQMYGHLPSIMKTIQIRRTRNWDTTGEVRTNSKVIYSGGPPHTDEHSLDNQLELIKSSSVPIQDVAWKTCREHWTIETGGKRGSGRSVLAARHDDDDDFFSFSWKISTSLLHRHHIAPSFSSSSFSSSK